MSFSKELVPYLTSDKAKTHANFQTGFSSMLLPFLEAAKEAGHDIQIFSGYRSPEHQAKLYNDALKKYGSEAAARKWVAPPGKSQHNHGLAADLSYSSDDAKLWAHNNASSFGMHFRMGHEPWHIEPIDRDAALTPNSTRHEEPVGAEIKSTEIADISNGIGISVTEVKPVSANELASMVAMEGSASAAADAATEGPYASAMTEKNIDQGIQDKMAKAQGRKRQAAADQFINSMTGPQRQAERNLYMKAQFEQGTTQTFNEWFATERMANYNTEAQGDDAFANNLSPDQSGLIQTMGNDAALAPNFAQSVMGV